MFGLQALGLSPEQLTSREVEVVDIAYDEISPKHYKIEEDLKLWQSAKTSRGPLAPDWLKSGMKPMMCSYKLVSVSFEVWGLQTRVEDYVQRAIREILLVGHRQAVAWLDQWLEMNEEDVRRFESQMHSMTNDKVRQPLPDSPSSPPTSPNEELTPTRRGWFSWS